MNEKSVEVILSDHEKKIVELQTAIEYLSVRKLDNDIIAKKVIKAMRDMEKYHRFGWNE
jgi:hypothetical protein